MENNTNNKKVILSLDNLKKYFINQGFVNKAVDGVSFDVHEGEIVGLIGESGSGKTTVGRTLMRLYEDYNGFVRLDGKIISGKHITNKRRKFLRRNIQMIFQDPHASLNGQQPIYSILKEPLLVNGIMSDKLADIFKDWQAVKSSFKYTFHVLAMELELENLKDLNKLAQPHFDKWEKKLSEFNFSSDLPIEDNFNAFFGYLEEKQAVESSIINNLYSNTSQLINYYYEYQSKYRNGELSDIEKKHLAAKEKQEKLETLSKNSTKGYEAKLKLKELKEEFAKEKEDLKELLSASSNTFINYIQEYKNEQDLANIARLMAIDLEVYLYNYKNECLYKVRREVLKSFKNKCRFLQFEEIRNLISELDSYVNDFYQEKLASLTFKKDVKAHIKKIIADEFKFEATKYIALSEQEEKQYQAKFAQYQAEIEAQKQIIRTENTPEITKEELKIAQEAAVEIEKEYLVGRAEYLSTYKLKIKELYEAIQDQEKLYNTLKNQQTICNQKYEELKAKFFPFLKSLIVDERSKVQIESLISIYKSDLFVKEETLKSFDIEKKYLNKDISDIYLLLGVDHKWVEQNLTSKNAEAKLNDENQYGKWQNKFSIFNYKVFNFLARPRIARLLYKIIIYKALEDVGLLKQFAYRYPHEFSGGQLQRIVIARALITEPKVIIADEPIASLDISIQAQVVNLLKELCLEKNIGLVFIAHDLSMIEYVADNVQIMHIGKIVEFGKTEAIYEKPIHPYTINLFKAIPKISNVNEKFQNVSFELDYLNEQQFPNIPSVYNVEENHFVYGTSEQVKKWLEASKEASVEAKDETPKATKPKKTVKKFIY
ncbi:phosphate ABC transporter ATP-binding protein [Metamycoplasma arthritidis]|uniref:Oligopeptide ABC transporter ATP-binding protein n=1 Tax=Metamycoplasma arthritidis (strain 158L3-1) TaxID=243272 RepID=B3PML2_META1|nr:ATP-binding cassette domain-containing protein [Metamycoplasma arthritidis]ACF07264.1 oligopeptide ABC transporter ATP-binding protein [Metamycoplasma arthritidis 158L3-1]VEU78787.1 phosphate ABC transporter ATP-binding protein [Metamycoplasma arthritidis]